MRKLFSLTAVAALGLWVAGAALGQAQRRTEDKSGNKALGADSEFVQKAASGGMLEVRLGQLAATKASNAAVRQFGERMVQDHTRANKQLLGILTAEGIRPPMAMSDKHVETFNHLAKLSGSEFDRAYMKHMVEDHKEDVALFEKEAKGGKDAKVKAFAEETLPVIKEHLQLAQKTSEKVGGKKDGKDKER
jgi:putative membrane protein